MFYKKKNIAIVGLFIGMAFAACYQSDPPAFTVPEIKGDFAFAGYQWKYKNATTPVGPGPNRFSGTSEFAWVDSAGQLHMKIAKKNNFWTCSEIIILLINRDEASHT